MFSFCFRSVVVMMVVSISNMRIGVDENSGMMCVPWMVTVCVLCW